MISGSDFHEYEDLGRGGIAVEKMPSKISELTGLLKSGNYKLIRDKSYQEGK